MGYHRVCPRDLFNEAQLLKCMGQISLFILDDVLPGLHMEGPEFEEAGPGFQIEQDESDGSISVVNLRFSDRNGEPVYFYTPLNSRDKWPLMMNYKEETYYCFQENGALLFSDKKFTEELD